MKHVNDFIKAVEDFAVEQYAKRGTMLAVKIQAKPSFMARMTAELIKAYPLQTASPIADHTLASIMTSVGRVDIRDLDEDHLLPFLFEVDYPPCDPDWE